jgi:hypothetical protein
LKYRVQFFEEIPPVDQIDLLLISISFWALHLFVPTLEQNKTMWTALKQKSEEEKVDRFKTQKQKSKENKMDWFKIKEKEQKKH